MTADAVGAGGLTLVLRSRRPGLWIAGGVALLAVLLCLDLGLTLRQRADNAMVAHSLVVGQRLAAVLSRLQDAEIGGRGYELTRRQDFLGPYDQTLRTLGPDLDALGVATTDNPRQQAALSRLRGLASAKMAEVATGLTLTQTPASGPPLLRSLSAGKTIMDAARREITGMQDEEAGLLIVRQARAEATFFWTWAVSLAGLAVVGVVTVVGLRDNARRIALVTAARDDLTAANAALIAGVARSEAAEAQVRQMHKMEAVGQLTGGIAHDFNNMLAIVVASLDLARRQIRSHPDKATERIDTALDAANRAAILTARLLAFSRQQALSPAVLDPNRLVSGMSELLRRTIGEQIRVETILGGGLWRVHADAAQLENAVLNLCVNARDAMPGGGRLTIETSNAHLDDSYARLNADVLPGQYVLVAVTDSGAGMTPDVVRRAFEPFYTTKAVGKGTGLGLSQVFGFVKQSGGHAKIYSESGVGTSVKIYLPRWFGPDETPAVSLAAPVRQAAGRNEVVLVVEDDPDVQRLSIDALRYLGYAVLHASSGEEALQVMALNPRIDLLFTDLVMPGMTGRVLADHATALSPAVRVLYTTGYTRNAVVHNGVLDAGVALLPKPFTVDQLAAKVRDVLDAPATTP